MLKMKRKLIIPLFVLVFTSILLFSNISTVAASSSHYKSDSFSNPPSVGSDIWTESQYSSWARNGKKYVSSWWWTFLPMTTQYFYWYIPSGDYMFREFYSNIYPYYKYAAADRSGECIYIVQNTAGNPEVVIAWESDDSKGKVWFGIADYYNGQEWVYEVLWNSGWSSSYKELEGYSDRMKIQIYTSGRVRCWFQGTEVYDDTPDEYETGGSGHYNAFKFWAWSNDVWNPLRKAGLDYWNVRYYH